MADCDVSKGLEGLIVVDLAHGLSGGISAKLLAELGARVRRFELTSDPFGATYPAHDAWHRLAEVSRVDSFEDPSIAAALGDATLCLIGGEDYPDWSPRLDADTISRLYPNLVVLEIEGYPSTSADNGRIATELLVQARTGLASEQFSDRPFHIPFSPAGYCAALHGVAGALAALSAVARGSGTRVVRTSLYEGAMTLGAQYWLTAEQPVRGFYRGIPKDPRQIIVRCSDGRYVHIVLGAAGAKGSLYRILQINDPNVRPEDSGVPTGKEEPRNFFGDVDLLSSHAEAFDSAILMTELMAAGVPASFVTAPGECWSDPQIDELRIIATDDRGFRHVGRTCRGSFYDATVAPLQTSNTEGGPLAGMRVLDFGAFTAGPFASVALADLGADVIKVETPQGDANAGIATSFATANRGKRTIVIDLKSPEGRAINERLIASADVVYNNFRPGVSHRLGLDPVALLARDPSKVVLESTGFGRTGPNAKRPGFDMILQAYTGHEMRASGEGNVPQWDRTTMVDYITGLLSQVALLAGLWRRTTGRGGADLDVSLVDGGLFLMSDLLQATDGAMLGNTLLNASQTGFHPGSAFYRTRDGWIAVDAVDEAMAGRLATLVGAPVRPRADWNHGEQDAIAGWAAASSSADAIAALEGAKIWAEHCERAGADALRRGGAPSDLLVTRPHPVYGAITQLAALFRLDDRRPTAARGVPTSGEHTREILASLGYTGEEIDGFYAQRAVA